MNQELAIILYRRFSNAEHVPVLAFQETGVRWEGFLAQSMVNPCPLGTVDEVCDQVRRWLATENFTTAVNREAFETGWGGLTPADRTVVRALQDLQGERVHQTPLRLRLRARYGIDLDQVAIRVALDRIRTTGLIVVERADPGHDQASIQSGWRIMVRRRLEEEGHA